MSRHDLVESCVTSRQIALGRGGKTTWELVSESEPGLWASGALCGVLVWGASVWCCAVLVAEGHPPEGTRH